MFRVCVYVCNQIPYISNIRADCNETTLSCSMQLCEKDAVDYIEPNGRVTLPPTSTQTPVPTDDFESSGFGSGDDSSNVVVPDVTNPPSTPSTTTTLVVPDLEVGSGSDPSAVTPTTCTKVHGDILPTNNYLIIFQTNSLQFNMENLYKLLHIVKNAVPSFDTSKGKAVNLGSQKGFSYNGLSKEAVIMVRHMFSF